MNNTKHRSPFAVAARLIVLVRPMLPIMLAAIVMGAAGHFCATFITIFGGFGILRALGLASPVGTVGTAFACILVFALLRGLLLLVPSFIILPIAFGDTGIWLALAVSELLTMVSIIGYMMIKTS